MITFLEQLTFDSTLGDLPLHHISVHLETPVRVVAELLEQDFSLPGVLIEDQRSNLSFFSRQWFRERLNCATDREIFLDRPIVTLLDINPLTDPSEIVVLSHREKIHRAVQRGLERSFEHAYDPILVISEDSSSEAGNQSRVQTRSLLDFRTVLLAQSYLVNHLQISPTLGHPLAFPSEALTLQSQEIDRLNQQILLIRKLLSEKGQEAFEVTFTGIRNSCRTSEQLLEVGNALRNELNTIGYISKSIAKISRQVHHLSVKASIIISQSTMINSPNDSLAGFSTINEEIGNLVSQTFDAGRQIEQVSTEFRQRIETFVHVAQEGLKEARSVVALAEQAQMVLHRLEAAVNHPFK
jgi:hypothetical protein